MMTFSALNRMFNIVVVLAGFAILAAFGVPAHAADPYGYGYGPSTGTSWRGFYAGVHAGGSFGDAGAFNPSGFIGGIHGGYNAQYGQAVFGGEADLTLSDSDSKSFTSKFRERYLASARLRIGYAINSFLLFGTGGLALGGYQYKDALGSSDKSEIGLVLGAGAQYKVANNVALRGEYLHYSFGSETYQTSYGPASIGPSSNVLRAGVDVGF